MKQIHIKKNPTLPQDDLGTKVVLKINSIVLPDYCVRSEGLTYCTLPFELKRIDEFENDFHVDFKLTKEACARGILLIGAYLEERDIRVLLASMMPTPIILNEGFPLLELNFLEKVHLRAIEPFQVLQSTPAPKKRNASRRNRKV